MGYYYPIEVVKLVVNIFTTIRQVSLDTFNMLDRLLRCVCKDEGEPREHSYAYRFLFTNTLHANICITYMGQTDQRTDVKDALCHFFS